MWKLLLIIVLVIYVLNKIGLFRVFVQSNQRDQRHQYRSNDGDVNVDNNPHKKKSDFKGGEYVDYEEVK